MNGRSLPIGQGGGERCGGERLMSGDYQEYMGECEIEGVGDSASGNRERTIKDEFGGECKDKSGAYGAIMEE